MPRLHEVTPENAQGEAKELLQKVQNAFGKIPNLVNGVANSPAALKVMLSFDEHLEGAALDEAARHAVYLVTSQRNGCDYCVSAHAYLGKKAGLNDEQIQAARTGNAQEATYGALIRFTQAVLETKGFVSDEQLQAFRDAGYDDAAAVEVVAVIAQATFTNYFNHVYGTEVDFPQAPAV